MIIAAIETSTQAQSVAFVREGTVAASLSLPAVSTHGRELAAAVQSAAGDAGVSLRSITHFVVGSGPGSFTGLRVGLAYARGCALANGARVVLASSLRAMAYDADESDALVAVALDARRGEVWSAVYTRGPRPRVIVEPASRQPARFAEVLAELGGSGQIVGNGPAVYTAAFIGLDEAQWSRRVEALPHAEALARIAWNELTAGVALTGGELDYLRDADAALPAVAQSRTIPDASRG